MGYRYNAITGELDFFDSGETGNDITQIDTDAGSASPVMGIVKVLGTAAQGISSSGAGNTVTLTIDDATEIQKGVVELATDAEAIGGIDTSKAIVSTSLKAKFGAQTANALAYGTGDTLALGWTNALTDGQIVIGSTAGSPQSANISSTGGTVTITNGANTINLEAGASVPTSFVADAGTAIPAANILNVLGGNNIGTVGAANNLTVNLTGTTTSAVQIGNATGSLTSVGPGTTGQLLVSTTGGDPSWSTVSYGDFSFNNVTGVGVPRTVSIANTDVNAASTVDLRLSTPPLGGDSMVSWEVQGTLFYAAGVDNSDSDSWKLSNSSSPSGGDALIATTSAGVITLFNDLDVTEGGTGVSTFTDGGILIGNAGADIQVTAAPTSGQILIGSTGVDPVLGSLTSTGETLVITEGAGTLNIDTQTVLQTDTGFGTWDAAGPYFDDTTLGEFDVLVAGSGYIKGVPVSWTAPQTVSGMTAGNSYIIYIDDTGTIGKTTTYSLATFQDYIPLFECLRDSTAAGNNQVTVKENHPYEFPPAASYWAHETVGVIIENHAGGANITLNGTQKIQINGDDELSDHGLYTDIDDSAGVGVVWNQYFTLASGKWARASQSDTFTGQYNNAGSVANLTGGKYGVYKLYVSKDNVTSTTPVYFAVLHTAEYNNLTAAQTAVANGLIASVSGELAFLELARLGYIIYQESISTIVDVIIDKQTLGSGSTTSGTNVASLVITDTSNFDGWLSVADTNVQAALDTLDDVGLGVTPEHAVLLGGASYAIDATAVGATGTVLIGNTGADPTFSATPVVTSVHATTFDTNVAAAGVTLAGTTLAADGTDAAIDIVLTPKGIGDIHQERSLDAVATRIMTSNTSNTAQSSATFKAKIAGTTARQAGVYCVVGSTYYQYAGILGSDGSYRIGSNVAGIGTADDSLIISQAGAINFNNEYTFPTTDGNANDVLTTDGAGTVTWDAPTAGGIVEQRVNASTGALVTCTTLLPFDDTIPQKTEGDEVITVTITPTSAANTLVIEFEGQMGAYNGSNSYETAVALFQDATTNALAAGFGPSVTTGAVGVIGNSVLTHTMVAGTTSATTFKIRSGPNINTYPVYFNGQNTNRKFAGLSATTLSVTEYAAGSPVTPCFTWSVVTANTNMAVNNGYIIKHATPATQLDCTLPTTAAIGDTVKISGYTSGGFKIVQNAGEQIFYGNQATTVGAGGYLESTDDHDSIELLCITANTEWKVEDSVGNFTVV
jgi:hypothetical protein